MNSLRTRHVVGLLGGMAVTRHYYHCADCGHGFAPWDAVLGLDATRQTPAAKEVMALGGAIDSFAESADKVLERMSGLSVSESTIERVTEAVGARIGEVLASGQVFGESKAWEWHKDADGKTVAYVSLDATGVGIQGRRGARAEGRMVNVMMVYNPIPDDRTRWAHPDRRRPPWQARYATRLSGGEELGELGEVARRQGEQVGMDGAERWVAISDGGSGLESVLRTYFPRVEIVILDYYHASEYLGEIARALHPGDEKERKAWLADWCHELKHQGGPAVLTRLRAMRDARPPTAVRQPLEQAITYYENQAHRMDYPAYLARGWQIGSGPVESACKSVIGARMKQAGMRWGTDGAEEVAHVRALFRSEVGQWDSFWSSYSTHFTPQK